MLRDHRPTVFSGLQVLVRAQEAKVIEEKAAKIKDWVTLKLKEVRSHHLQHVQQAAVASGVPTRSPAQGIGTVRVADVCLWCRWNKRTSS